MNIPLGVLGPAVREHRGRWTFSVASLLLGTVFTLVCLAGLARAGYNLVTEDSSNDTSVTLGASLLFMIPGALLLFWGAAQLRKVVTLHHGGFYYKDRKGERAVIWQEIDGVYQKILRVYHLGVEVDVQDSYTIALRDGARIVVDYHFADVEHFGAAVTDAVTSMLLPVYREAFRAGQRLDFGAVWIDGQGVYADGKMLPWHEVQGMSWKQGILVSDRAFLQIRRAGGLLAWAKPPIEEIKNYPVLIALAGDIGKAE